MDNAKQQLIDKLRSSNNVLVTVGRNPSVDQLSALLGLTLFLNKQGKHAAAVFSGEVPSTLEFLRPEATIEKNTDSLRDFIIALDKSKADKLRYKVEDDVVRIFITPYKTSISQDDFEFSQGDFNVDVVVALGVNQQEDLDEAIIAHGRILHDATVTSINVGGEGGIGVINWHQPESGSLSESVTELVQALGADLLDEQIATALLTGIVAETARFSNEKTTAETMSASATLMAAGANQQLVASKLEEPDSGGSISSGGSSPDPDRTDDGTLEIDHEGEEPAPDFELPEPNEEEPAAEESSQEESAEDGLEQENDNHPNVTEGPHLITQPPSLGGPLTASSEEEGLDTVINPLGDPQSGRHQLLNRKTTIEPLSDKTSEDNAEPEKLSETEAPVPPAEAPAAAPDPAPAPAPVAEEPPAPQFTPPPPAWMPPGADTAAPAPAPAPVIPPAQDAPAAPVQDAPLAPPQDSPLPPPPAASDDSASSSAATASAASSADDGHYSTLAELEESITSPHIDESPAPAAAAPDPLDTSGLDAARDEVNRALSEAAASGATAPEPIQALGAQPLGDNLHGPQSDSDNNLVQNNGPTVTDPTAPPPVPPPFQMPPLGNQPPQQ